MEKDLECIVCYELPEHVLTTSCCGQVLCAPCSNRIAVNNPALCPFCRAPLRTAHNKCVARVINKLRNMEYSRHSPQYSDVASTYTGEENRSRHRSEPGQRTAPRNGRGGGYSMDTWRVNERERLARKIGNTGKYYCGRARADHAAAECCAGECNLWCGPSKGCNCWHCMRKDRDVRGLEWDELVNREGRTARRGKEGWYFCERVMEERRRGEEAMRGEHGGVEELAEQMSGLGVVSTLQRCTESDPCGACICLSVHGNEYTEDRRRQM